MPRTLWTYFFFLLGVFCILAIGYSAASVFGWGALLLIVGGVFVLHRVLLAFCRARDTVDKGKRWSEDDL